MVGEEQREKGRERSVSRVVKGVCFLFLSHELWRSGRFRKFSGRFSATWHNMAFGFTKPKEKFVVLARGCELCKYFCWYKIGHYKMESEFKHRWVSLLLVWTLYCVTYVSWYMYKHNKTWTLLKHSCLYKPIDAVKISLFLVSFVQIFRSKQMV